MNRRKFIRHSALSTVGIFASANLAGCSSGKKIEHSSYGIMDEVKKYRKIDAHAHVDFDPDDFEKQIDFADRLGIDKLCVSRPITNFSGNEPEDHEEVKRSNNLVLQAMKQFPDRIIGFMTLNPVYQKESLEEIGRCAGEGMAGYKAYTQVTINDPLYFPIIEKFIGLNMIMLMHGFCQLGVGGYRMKYDAGMAPNTSIPEDFVDAAKRYPEGMFQFAHIGGGADWEYECKLFKDHRNIYVDTSGSNNEENMIDFAVRQLGEDRLFYGSDGSYYQGVGKILCANLTESQKKKIFFENYNNILKKGGHHVG
ncbi:MAG: amidohydrolase [Cyclobacteriaceae bacterium]|nr:amidohydrolase [Cyclobacteriaceae bacterium]